MSARRPQRRMSSARPASQLPNRASTCPAVSGGSRRFSQATSSPAPRGRSFSAFDPGVSIIFQPAQQPGRRDEVVWYVHPGRRQAVQHGAEAILGPIPGPGQQPPPQRRPPMLADPDAILEPPQAHRLPDDLRHGHDAGIARLENRPRPKLVAVQVAGQHHAVIADGAVRDAGKRQAADQPHRQPPAPREFTARQGRKIHAICLHTTVKQKSGTVA